MFCAKCGNQVSENDTFCGKCGAPVTRATNPPPAPTPQAAPVSQAPTVQVVIQEKRTSGMAVTALVLGILGLSLFAIIFGAIAMNQTKKDPNLSGRGMAIAGLVLGIIGMVSWVIWGIFFAIFSIGSMSFL